MIMSNEAVEMICWTVVGLAVFWYLFVYNEQ